MSIDIIIIISIIIISSSSSSSRSNITINITMTITIVIIIIIIIIINITITTWPALESTPGLRTCIEDNSNKLLWNERSIIHKSMYWRQFQARFLFARPKRQ